jgi:hypothetical protein
MIILSEKNLNNSLKRLSLIFKSVKIQENVNIFSKLVTYFVEKFPKRIFDLFDLYVSRIKGFYNE